MFPTRDRVGGEIPIGLYPVPTAISSEIVRNTYLSSICHTPARVDEQIEGRASSTRAVEVAGRENGGVVRIAVPVSAAGRRDTDRTRGSQRQRVTAQRV